MKAYDGEFEALTDQFERDMGKIIYGHKFERVPRCERSKVPSTVFYQDGYVNDLFSAYMRGFAYKEALVR